MKHIYRSIIVLLVVLLSSQAFSQQRFGFAMPDGIKKIKIPFELYNNLIVIPLKINGLSLKFILDTGVENAILTESLYAEILDISYLREIRIAGPGVIDSVEVYVGDRVQFELPGNLIGYNMDLLVLKQDYLKLSEYMGEGVYGIVGYDIFNQFVVDINYQKKELSLYRPSTYKPKKKYQQIPIKLIKSKPIVPVSLYYENKKYDVDLLVDTGASHSALVDFSILGVEDLPDERIDVLLGRGIAGNIPGNIIRIDSIVLSDLSFEKPIVSVPYEGVYNKMIKKGARIGTLGGDLLLRTRPIIDYHAEKIYLHRSPSYREPFEFDMSGIKMITKGTDLDTLTIVEVLKDSPADEAGIQVDDVVLSINGSSLRSKKLTELNAELRRRPNYRIKCKIKRGEEILIKRFRLARLI